MTVLWISERAGAQQRQDQPPEIEVVLVPHRATYEMKLSVARPNSGIVEVNGRMVLETVDSCEGWEIKQRIKLTFLRNDGEEFETDSNFSSYESKDGLELRFSVRNVQNEEVEPANQSPISRGRGQRASSLVPGNGAASAPALARRLCRSRTWWGCAPNSMACLDAFARRGTSPTRSSRVLRVVNSVPAG